MTETVKPPHRDGHTHRVRDSACYWCHLLWVEYAYRSGVRARDVRLHANATERLRRAGLLP